MLLLALSPALMFWLHLKSISTLIQHLSDQTKSYQNSTDRSLGSSSLALSEAIRLLSTKDPIAFAQVSEVGTALNLAGQQVDMTDQFQTDDSQARAWLLENGIENWEGLTDDERNHINEVNEGNF